MPAEERLNDLEYNELAKRVIGKRGFESLAFRNNKAIPNRMALLFIEFWYSYCSCRVS